MDSVKLDLFHLDLFHDVVFAFTPAGEVKELPVGSTPVDFAYAIHTEIGDHCLGAKVNGKIASLRHRLNSGDTVEILTSPTQVPNKSWVKFVQTSRARAKIKHWLKIEEQKRGLELGQRLLERELRRSHYPLTETLGSEKFHQICQEKGYESNDELIRMIGYGRISASQIIGLLSDSPDDTPGEEAPENTLEGNSAGHHVKSVLVKGTGDAMMQALQVLQSRAW